MDSEVDKGAQFTENWCLAHGFKVIWLLALLLCVVQKTKPPFWRPASFLFGGQKLHMVVKIAVFGCKISRLCLAPAPCGARSWVDGERKSMTGTLKRNVPANFQFVVCGCVFSDARTRTAKDQCQHGRGILAGRQFCVSAADPRPPADRIQVV